MHLTELPAEVLAHCVLFLFNEFDVHGGDDPLEATHNWIVSSRAFCAHASILWTAAADRFLQPLKPLLLLPLTPNIVVLRRIVTKMRKACRGETLAYVGRERDGDAPPTLPESDCNEYNFKLLVQPPRRQQRQPVITISWQCTKVASGYRPLSRREASRWEVERVSMSGMRHSACGQCFVMQSETRGRAASRVPCRYDFELIWNGLAVRLRSGTVLQGTGPNHQQGWAVLDDPAFVPRVHMLPHPLPVPH